MATRSAEEARELETRNWEVALGMERGGIKISDRMLAVLMQANEECVPKRSMHR